MTMSDSERMTMTLRTELGFPRADRNDEDDPGEHVPIPPGQYELRLADNPFHNGGPRFLIFTYEGAEFGATVGYFLSLEYPEILTLDIPDAIRTEIKLRNAERLDGKLVIEVVEHGPGFKARIRDVPGIWGAGSAVRPAVNNLISNLTTYGLSRDRKDYLVHLNF